MNSNFIDENHYFRDVMVKWDVRVQRQECVVRYTQRDVKNLHMHVGTAYKNQKWGFLPSWLRYAPATAKKVQEVEFWLILGGIFDYQPLLELCIYPAR